ncbi:MAG TPA: glutathione S-transferase [Rhizomicrobium sp.]|nr:glutathione S-transferase [Rhizomicrobium sp.]
MITLYHAPRSRSSSILWLLEELGVPYKIALTPIVYGNGQGAPAPESYRAIHPHKKVPAIDDDGRPVFESAAIVLYLADKFSLGNLAPRLDDPRRAAYVTWVVYYSAGMSPIATARFQGWDSDNNTGFGTMEDMETFLTKTLEAHPYIVGDSFTAADVLVGGAVRFFKSNLLSDRKCYDDYIARLDARPALKRAQAKDNG